MRASLAVEYLLHRVKGFKGDRELVAISVTIIITAIIGVYFVVNFVALARLD